MPRFLHLGSLVCLLALMCAQAVAQDVSLAMTEPAAQAEPAGYRELVAQAIAEYDARHFEEARSLFVRAHESFPNARTARGIGMTEFELRNYGECIRRLDEALSSSVRPLEGALREETEQLLARARGFVARLSLEVRPTSARIWLDGEPIAYDPGARLVVPVGEHVLEFRAQGHVSERRVLHTAGGEERTLYVVLTPDGAALVQRERAPAPRPFYKRAWFWAPLTAALVAGAAVVLGVTMTRSDHAEVAPPYPGTSGERPFMGPSR